MLLIVRSKNCFQRPRLGTDYVVIVEKPPNMMLTSGESINMELK
jgi:hypothetical protein